MAQRARLKRCKALCRRQEPRHAGDHGERHTSSQFKFGKFGSHLCALACASTFPTDVIPNEP